MSEWYDALTSREWAVTIWFAIALILVLIHPKLRQSLGQVVKCLFRPIFLKSFGAGATYIAGSVWLLHRYEFWGLENLKTTIIWVFTVGFVEMFRVKQLQDPTFYRKIVRETISITALVTFFAEFFTFPLIVELFLFPLLATLTFAFEVYKNDERYNIAEGCTGWILAAIGFLYVGYSTYRTFSDSSVLITVGSAKEFLVPAALTALYLPFLYLFGIWVRYNDIFAILPIWIPDGKVRRYAKRQALFRFGLDVKTLDRWRQFVVTTKPATREDVLQSIVEAWSLKARDRYPLPVAPEEGWEPVSATRLLSAYSLETSDYKPLGGDEWSSSSPYLKLGSDRDASSAIFQNNLAFYVLGTQFAANELTLILNVNVPNDAPFAEQQFLAVGMTLLEKAVGAETTEALKSEFAGLEPFSRRIGETLISLERDDWSGGVIEDGYDWALKLRRGRSLSQ